MTLLLRFVAVYSIFDSVNLVVSFAVRGAGDTRFVALVGFLRSLADDGAADVAAGPIRRRRHGGVGVRHALHLPVGWHVHLAVRDGKMEDDAGDRGGSPERTVNYSTRSSRCPHTPIDSPSCSTHASNRPSPAGILARET